MFARKPLKRENFLNLKRVRKVVQGRAPAAHDASAVGAAGGAATAAEKKEEKEDGENEEEIDTDDLAPKTTEDNWTSVVLLRTRTSDY